MPNFDTVLLNKQNWCKSKMTFEFFNTKFHRPRWKQMQPFTFLYCVDNFYLWKDIVGKKVSKLRSIAELRAFYGMSVKKKIWGVTQRKYILYKNRRALKRQFLNSYRYSYTVTISRWQKQKKVQVNVFVNLVFTFFTLPALVTRYIQAKTFNNVTI